MQSDQCPSVQVTVPINCSTQSHLQLMAAGTQTTSSMSSMTDSVQCWVEIYNCQAWVLIHVLCQHTVCPKTDSHSVSTSSEAALFCYNQSYGSILNINPALQSQSRFGHMETLSALSPKKVFRIVFELVQVPQFILFKNSSCNVVFIGPLGITWTFTLYFLFNTQFDVSPNSDRFSTQSLFSVCLLLVTEGG